MIIDGKEYDELGAGEVSLAEKGGDTSSVTGEDIFSFFTSAEWLAFITIKNGDNMNAASIAERFYAQMLGYWNKQISVTNPTLVGYFNQLVSAGIITAERRSEFLGS